MKLYVLLLFVLAVLLSAVYGAPSKGSTKASLKKKQSCVKECGDTYKPICAGDASTKGISFGSACVLENYNCENHKELNVLSEGECPGGGGVRLS
ncbi:agrin-like [Cylas formicarius]|uniref:agrin-like n=1 Tax=Cylas formicarius TaxID=197179 RepID=UPI0029586729|nr:agrin-like [Cylas formicarius]